MILTFEKRWFRAFLPGAGYRNSEPQGLLWSGTVQRLTLLNSKNPNWQLIGHSEKHSYHTNM